MTKEELKIKIDQCVEDIQHYEDIDEYYYGYYYGQLDIYQKWLKEKEQCNETNNPPY